MKSENSEINEKCNMFITLSKTNLFLYDIESQERSFFQYFSPPQFLFDRIFEDINSILNRYINTHEDKGFFYKDDLDLCYILMVMNRDKHIVVLGPFLDEITSEKVILDYAHVMRLTAEELRILKNLYKKLPIYEDEEITNIHTLLRTILSNSLIKMELKSPVHTTSSFTEKTLSDKFDHYEFAESNYKIETLLLDAITRGDTEYIKEFIERRKEGMIIPERGPFSTLRHWKNLSITMNSICARAAYKGGLSPDLVHSISSKYAVEIERLVSYHSVNTLLDRIMTEYAESVKRYSLKGYSTLIRQAIQYIRNNITQTVYLLDVAEHLNISEEHLSRAFKKETGKTVIHFIQEAKIIESQELLLSGNYSITDIAFMFGFSSSSYYSTTFRKITGISPTAFQKRNNSRDKLV